MKGNTIFKYEVKALPGMCHSLLTLHKHGIVTLQQWVTKPETGKSSKAAKQEKRVDRTEGEVTTLLC